VLIAQDEIERIHIENDVLSHTFDNRLVFPPLSRLRRVLDCGFGTASWAYQVAEENPNCEVSASHHRPGLYSQI